jgi:hypothetical protein
MKTIFIPSLIILMLISVSCGKDWLQTYPPDGVSTDEYYTNAEEAETAVNACYDNLSAQFDRMYGLGIDAIGLYCGDLCQSGTTDPRNFSMFENNNQDGSEFVIEIVWREAYAGIYRCNLFLEKAPDIPMDDALKARFVGEVKFLRGYYYFELSKVFGDVPLVLKTLDPDEAYVERTPREEVVAQIEKDYLDAIAALPLKSEYSTADLGRVTKGTAQAYLMKLYVYQQKWSQAVAEGADLIASEEYGLFDDYIHNFSIDHENGIESIFEVQCKEGTQTGEGNAHNDLEGFTGTPNPRGYTQPFKEYYFDTFLNNADGVIDPRQTYSVQFNVISSTFYATVKYIIGLSSGRQYDAENNYKLMRYSDFLLLYAEALNESGNTTEALTYINMVRQRPNVNMPPLSGLSKEDLRKAIYDERKWELGMEGHRFFDLVRWGIAGEVIRGQGRKFTDGVHELMPLPIREMDLNPNLTQNPGY